MVCQAIYNEQSHDRIAEAIASLPIFTSEPGLQEAARPRIERDWVVDRQQWDVA